MFCHWEDMWFWVIQVRIIPFSSVCGEKTGWVGNVFIFFKGSLAFVSSHHAVGVRFELLLKSRNARVSGTIVFFDIWARWKDLLTPFWVALVPRTAKLSRPPALSWPSLPTATEGNVGIAKGNHHFRVGYVTHPPTELP